MQREASDNRSTRERNHGRRGSRLRASAAGCLVPVAVLGGISAFETARTPDASRETLFNISYPAVMYFIFALSMAVILGAFVQRYRVWRLGKPHGLPDEQKRSFRFLHVSTDEVFGSLGPDGYFTEETPYAPNSPYSASKASSDHFVRAYFHTYGLPTVITNCSNNYGPYQFPEKLIPLMIMNALSGRSLPVYGDGSNVRDWIYVGDHCNAVKLAFEKGRPGEVYAVGASNEQKNLNIVNQICSILDDVAPPVEIPELRDRGLKSYKELIRFVTDRPGHDRLYAFDSSKIQRELGWQPEIDFEEGLRRTIDWYLTNPKWVEQAGGGSYSEWIEKNYAWRAGKETK